MCVSLSYICTMWCFIRPAGTIIIIDSSLGILIRCWHCNASETRNCFHIRPSSGAPFGKMAVICLCGVYLADYYSIGSLLLSWWDYTHYGSPPDVIKLYLHCRMYISCIYTQSVFANIDHRIQLYDPKQTAITGYVFGFWLMEYVPKRSTQNAKRQLTCIIAIAVDVYDVNHDSVLCAYIETCCNFNETI